MGFFGRKKKEESSLPVEDLTIEDDTMEEEPENTAPSAADSLDLSDDLEEQLSDISEKPSIKGGEGTDDELDINNIKPAFFGPLEPFIMDDFITDVDFNGRKLWTTDRKGQKVAQDVEISEGFLAQFTQKINNSVNGHFSIREPELEAEARLKSESGEEVFLRITELSEAATATGRVINIRKNSAFPRVTVDTCLTPDEDGFLYAEPEMVAFLINSVKAHMNVVVCGEPGTGKTELSKFMSIYIPDNEKVVTIEDTLEWHYKDMKPNADCIEIKAYEYLDFSGAIKFCMRANPRWMMIAEVRDIEANEFVKALSTGVNGITSLHTDEVRRIPERIVRMARDKNVEDDVYDFVNVGVLVNRRTFGGTKAKRFIDQIGTFAAPDIGQEKAEDYRYRELFRSKKRTKNNIQDVIQEKFSVAGIDDPYYNEIVDKKCKERGIPYYDA